MSAIEFRQGPATTVTLPKPHRHSWWLTILYTACLVPLSADGFGINYLFALIPIVYVLSGRSLVRPRIEVTLYIYACAAAFTLANIYQISWIEFCDRRLISFTLHLTMFALCFLPISEKHIAALKLLLFFEGLIFAVQSLLLFMSLGAAAQAFESKDVVGSQQFSGEQRPKVKIPLVLIQFSREKFLENLSAVHRDLTILPRNAILWHVAVKWEKVT